MPAWPQDGTGHPQPHLGACFSSVTPLTFPHLSTGLGSSPTTCSATPTQHPHLNWSPLALPPIGVTQPGLTPSPSILHTLRLHTRISSPRPRLHGLQLHLQPPAWPQPGPLPAPEPQPEPPSGHSSHLQGSVDCGSSGTQGKTWDVRYIWQMLAKARPGQNHQPTQAGNALAGKPHHPKAPGLKLQDA